MTVSRKKKTVDFIEKVVPDPEPATIDEIFGKTPGEALLDHQLTEWGSCDITIFPFVVSSILNKRYDDGNTIIIRSINVHGTISDQPAYTCRVHSSKLTKGYHGYLDYVIVGLGDYKFTS